MDALLISPVQGAIVQQNNNNGSSVTSVTCTLARPAQGDIALVIVTSTQSVSSVTDSSSNTYTSRASTSLATGTTGAYVSFYLANITAGYGAQITITVHLSASAYVGVECMDIVGINVHPDHTSTGSGTISSATTFYVCQTVSGVNIYCINHQGLSVTSYQPAVNDFVVSAIADYGCFTSSGSSSFGYPTESAPIPSDDEYVHTGTLASPFYPTINTGGQVGIQTATLCGTSDHYQFFGGGSYNRIWPSGSTPTIQNFSTTTMPDQVTSGNTANFVVLSASFPSLTVSSTSTTESLTLTFHDATAATSSNDKQTLGLTPILAVPQKLLSAALGLFTITQRPQESPGPSLCLGVKANLTKGTYIVNTGAICGAPVVAGATLITACNFFQFQCWAIPLMYLGMIDGFFIGVAGAFRVTEKSALYLVIAGLTWGSLVEISLGIMTPMLPIMLIAMNVAYSFRLDKVVTQLVTNR